MSFTPFPISADAARTTVASYTPASGQITLASIPASMPTPTTSAPILVSVVATATYGTYPETLGLYLATGLTGDTLTGLTLINGVDDAWAAGTIVEMRMCAYLLNLITAAVYALQTGVRPPIYSMVSPTTLTSTGSIFTDTNAVGSRSLAAGFLNTLGRTIRVTILGIATTGSSFPTVYMYFELNSNCIATTVSFNTTASKTNAPFQASAVITVIATGQSGQLQTQGAITEQSAAIILGSQSTIPLSIVNATTPGTQAVATPVTLDLTAGYTLDFQAHFSAVSGFSFTFTQALIEVLA